MTEEQAKPQGTPPPIPAPPDFPVTWENPEDGRLFWTRDRVHYPDQISPLTMSTFRETVMLGWHAAAAAYELPVIGPRGILINHYVYTTMMPVVAPPAEMAARGKRSEEKLKATLVRLGALWENEWLPEAKEHLGFWESFDLTAASLPALNDHLQETLKRFKRIYDIHFLCFFPSALAVGLFDELYHDLFSPEGALEPYRLLQGFDNKNLEGHRVLWKLGRQALADPVVRSALETDDAARIPDVLEDTPEGRAFLAALGAFLAKYGRCTDKFGLDSPSWIEDPTPVIDNLKSYVTQPDRDLEDDLAKLAAERERSVAETRQRLNGYPRPVVDQFEMLLGAAQAATMLIEEHTFWLDYGSTYCVRQVLLEFGRRFAAGGAIPAPGDVFFLTLDELRETAATLPQMNRNEMIARRRAEWERFRHVNPPSALGTPPPGAPPDNPFMRAVGKFFGMPPRPTGNTSLLRGNPGSAGKARGPAKVVRFLSEAGKLKPGDILIAETTLPPWVPLFATAAAVVTDSGGILSHSAIVAREYQIPAVVGVGVATSAIRDGQIVEVDGDTGEVRIVSSTQEA
ncbi:MAG: hypothetical protein HYX94_06100 [Chloroflexi bacterium]|nr:hypothetical protein [Chloroflexota bacterium]